MRYVDSKPSRYNSPGEALHVSASSVALRPPIPDISEITNKHTQTHTQNTAINIIDIELLRLFLYLFGLPSFTFLFCYAIFVVLSLSIVAYVVGNSFSINE